MGQNDVFHCDVKEAANDEQGNRVTIVMCHGKLISDTGGELKNVVKPLIANGGKIVLDLAQVTHLDSSGLGTLVGLKASAINQGYCILQLENMTPRILDLLRVTNLTQMFAK
jgi:anti-anti-sigma factor